MSRELLATMHRRNQLEGATAPMAAKASLANVEKLLRTLNRSAGAVHTQGPGNRHAQNMYQCHLCLTSNSISKVLRNDRSS